LLFLLKTWAAFAPLFYSLLDLRQENSCVRIRSYFPDHAQHDVGNGCFFAFRDLCLVFHWQRVLHNGEPFFLVPPFADQFLKYDLQRHKKGRH
jgi:hypothetical protein